jgi:hypothetical protein
MKLDFLTLGAVLGSWMMTVTASAAPGEVAGECSRTDSGLRSKGYLLLIKKPPRGMKGLDLELIRGGGFLAGGQLDGDLLWSEVFSAQGGCKDPEFSLRLRAKESKAPSSLLFELAPPAKPASGVREFSTGSDRELRYTTSVSVKRSGVVSEIALECKISRRALSAALGCQPRESSGAARIGHTVLVNRGAAGAR